MYHTTDADAGRSGSQVKAKPKIKPRNNHGKKKKKHHFSKNLLENFDNTSALPMDFIQCHGMV